MRYLFTLAFLPAAAFAEVSDKAPTMAQLLLSTPLIAAVALLAIQWRVSAGIVATLIAAFLASGNYALTADPQIGPDLLREQGEVYVWVSYGSGAFIYIALVVGWIVRFVRRRHAV